MDKTSPALSGLDPRQLDAAKCVDGPVLIVAGAGSGKTRVLTSRIAYLLERGCDPGRILALTFTKKAAGEMKERVAAMVGGRKAWKIRMGTFHSVFVRFLREYAGQLGYPSNFTIYDTSDSQSAIKRCIKELKLDDKTYKPKDVLSRISAAKNNLVSVAGYRANLNAQKNDAAARRPRIVDLYAAYQEHMRQSGVMDFDDILVNMARLLHDFPDIARKISDSFQYILVDEYQDTNRAQYVILKGLAAVHRNLCVVGDDSQSIYAFRGARIENILNFRKDYPDARIFRLEENYRSTKNIVEAANSLIAKNEDRIPKHCYSSGDEGEKIRLTEAFSEQEEGLLIASSIIERMGRDKCEYKDFAILYRTNSQSRSLEEALRRRNLPYIIYSGNSFYDRAEVRDMMAYFKLAVNPDDDESFRRVVNTPARGIGNTTVEALVAAAASQHCSLYGLVAKGRLELYGIRSGTAGKLDGFVQMISKYCEKQKNANAFEVVAGLSEECGLYRMYKEDNTVESQSRAGNIAELLNSVQSYIEERDNEYAEEMMADGTISSADELKDSDYPQVSLADWLENVSLLSAVDVDDEESGNKIAMMTVHSAKGLEFPYVYVAGMEENLFPVGGFTASPKDVEEERRLFYVALTRAEKAVNLSFADTRMRNGRHESNPPSRFIREISNEYIENPLPKDSQSFGFSGSFGQDGYSSRPVHVRRDDPRSGFRERTAPAKPASLAGKILPSRMPDRRPAPPQCTPDKDFIPVSALALREGQRVEHNRFGFGKILKISGSGSQMKAQIAFDDYGEKVLLLQYAKLRLA